MMGAKKGAGLNSGDSGTNGESERSANTKCDEDRKLQQIRTTAMRSDEGANRMHGAEPNAEMTEAKKGAGLNSGGSSTNGEDQNAQQIRTTAMSSDEGAN
jgi:hypothetical protein